MKTELFTSGPDKTILTTVLKNTSFFFSSALISAVMSTKLAIPCHRIIILGIDSVSAKEFWHWTKRETRFAVSAFVFSATTYFVLSALVMLLLFPITFTVAVLENPLLKAYIVTYAGLSFAIIATSYIFCRLALIFPSIAIDEMLKIRSAWQLSHQNGWRLTLISAIFSCIQLAVFKIVGATNLVSLGLSFTLSIFGIVFLSLAYIELRKHVKE